MPAATVIVVATISNPGLLPEAVVSTVKISSKVPPVSVMTKARAALLLISKLAETETVSLNTCFPDQVWVVVQPLDAGPLVQSSLTREAEAVLVRLNMFGSKDREVMWA